MVSGHPTDAPQTDLGRSVRGGERTFGLFCAPVVRPITPSIRPKQAIFGGRVRIIYWQVEQVWPAHQNEPQTLSRPGECYVATVSLSNQDELAILTFENPLHSDESRCRRAKRTDNFPIQNSSRAPDQLLRRSSLLGGGGLTGYNDRAGIRGCWPEAEGNTECNAGGPERVHWRSVTLVFNVRLGSRADLALEPRSGHCGLAHERTG